MMKSEFESLAGRNVTDEQYKAIETLYMSSNLEKAEFVKSIRTMLKSIPQPEKKKDIKRMVVRDRSGYRKTPNGCYYHIECPVCEHEVDREDMYFTKDCHGIPFRLVCDRCYQRIMSKGYDGEYYTEADEQIEDDY
ncbi:hypothetical protein DXC11_11975 [Firmicutes bacterium OM08-11AC]|nr:hypothetical protein DXC11_11975 [Firmicutes bacterium OM08-11AC]